MLTVVNANEVPTRQADRSSSTRSSATAPGRCSPRHCSAEVAAYIDQFADQVDENGHRLVVRNGYHNEREVMTAAGAVTVKAPRVNDKRIDPDTGERQRFSSTILPAWARKSPEINEVLPLLYLHGLSTGDFGPALEQFLGSGAGFSAAPSPGSRPVAERSAAFADRDLSGTDLSTCGSTASTSRCGWSRRSCVCWS